MVPIVHISFALWIVKPKKMGFNNSSQTRRILSGTVVSNSAFNFERKNRADVFLSPVFF